MAGAYTRKYTVTNNGEVTSSGPVTLSLTSNSSSDFAVADGSCGPIAPNDSCMLSVRYTPATTGSDTAGLLFSNNGTQFLSSELSGTGVLPAEFTITAEEGLDFGRLVPGEVDLAVCRGEEHRWRDRRVHVGAAAVRRQLHLDHEQQLRGHQLHGRPRVPADPGDGGAGHVHGSDVSTLADVVISPDNYVRNLGPITLTGTATTTI